MYKLWDTEVGIDDNMKKQILKSRNLQILTNLSIPLRINISKIAKDKNEQFISTLPILSFIL